MLPHERDRLRHMMAACRPDGEDLADAEMSELAFALREDAALRAEWERQQHSDRAIAASMHDLAVPAGLAERILAAAAAAEAADSKAAAVTAVQADARASVSPVQSAPKRFSRRAWVAAVIAASLLTAFGTWFFWPPASRQIPKELLADYVVDWRQAAAPAEGWTNRSDSVASLFPTASMPAGYVAWKRLATRQEPSLVAFNLGSGSYLFAVKTRHKYQVNSIPFSTLSATGGVRIAAWQSGDVLYVVVLSSDDERNLQQVVRTGQVG